MRDAIHIASLLLLFALLAMQFPGGIARAMMDEPDTPPRVSFVALSPEVYASCLDAVRTSWQMRGKARGSLVAGRLDTDISLLDNLIAAPSFPAMDDAPPPPLRMPAPGAATYSMLPATMGVEVPALSARAGDGRHADQGGGRRPAAAFDRSEMLSVEEMTSLKEIMQ